MSRLDNWLEQATQHLSPVASKQVRSEIGAHYEDAMDCALGSGVHRDQADQEAVRALGDAHAANGRYRQVLTNSTEAKMLEQGNWEARMVCGRPSLRWALLGVPLVALCIAATLFLAGSTGKAWTLVAGAAAAGISVAPLFLPIYTPARGRAFRLVKWATWIAALGMAFHLSWLFFACIWPLLWVEWTRISIRRKLPVAQWPKQLYI